MAASPLLLVAWLTGGLPFVAPATAVVAQADAPAPAVSPREAAGGSLLYVVPAGWRRGELQGVVTLTPTDATADNIVMIVLPGVQPLGGRALEEWLRAIMDDDLRSGAKALRSAPAHHGRAGALETASAGRTIENRAGVVLLQIYHAISDGHRAGLAMVVAGSEAALQTRMPAVQAIVRSLGFSAAANERTPTGGSR